MGWWEDLTDTLGFTNHAKQNASHDAADAARNAAANTAAGITEGRTQLIDYYKQARDQLAGGQQAALYNLDQGFNQGRDVLNSSVAGAGKTIQDYLKQGQGLASQYYQPFQDSAVQALKAGTNLGKLTGTIASTPEEQAALVQGSPLYKWRLQQGQQALDRATRAKGIGDSRFSAAESGRLATQLTAEDQDRLISQLMDQYRTGMGVAGTSSNFGQNLADLNTKAGVQMADNSLKSGMLQFSGAQQLGQNRGNLVQDNSRLLAGNLQDLGTSVASSYGAIASAQNQGNQSAQAIEAQANVNSPNFLDQALKIYSAGSGTLWNKPTPATDSGWW